MVLDAKTKKCKPSKKGGAKRNNALAGARAESNPCKYGPKVDIGGKAKCPTRLLEANPAFKARYCKSGRFDLQIGKLPAYIVNPDPTGPRPRTCVRNPDVTKASKRSVMSGTAMSTRGFKIVNGQVVHVGLKKNDLVKNPRGRIVPKSRHEAGKKIYAAQSEETRAKFLNQQEAVRIGVHRARMFATNNKKSMTSGLWFNQPLRKKDGPTLKERAADCKMQGKVLNKRTKRCRDSKTKSGASRTSGLWFNQQGQTLKDLAAKCKAQGKVLEKVTKTCRDRKAGEVKGNSIAAMRYLCKQDGLVYNKKTHDCRASTKTSGGPTLKERAADCRMQGKVLNKATKRCRDRKKAPRKSPRIAQAVSKATLAALRLKCKEDGNQIYNQKTKQCRPRKSSGRKAAPKPRRSARIAAQ